MAEVEKSRVMSRSLLMGAKVIISSVVFAFFIAIYSDSSAEVVTLMTKERIQEAIQHGQTEDFKIKHYRIQEKSAWGNGPITRYFTTPFSRVALAAKKAHEEYRPFTIDDVTEDMIKPTLHVYGTSRIQNGVLVSAKTIVIMPYKNEDLGKVEKPLAVKTIEQKFQNLFGATWEAQSLMAVFPISLLSESNEVHVVFDAELNTGSSVAKCCCKDCKMRFDLDKVR